MLTISFAQALVFLIELSGWNQIFAFYFNEINDLFCWRWALILKMSKYMQLSWKLRSYKSVNIIYLMVGMIGQVLYKKS